MSHYRQYRGILEPLTSRGSGGQCAARGIHSADIDLGSTVTRRRNKWNGSSRCQRMIRILKYEKASGSAKCQTGVGVGGYVAVVINPRRQIPCSSTECEKQKGNGEAVKKGEQWMSKKKRFFLKASKTIRLKWQENLAEREKKRLDLNWWVICFTF